LYPGASAKYTIPAGTTIGFWLKSNGYSDPGTNNLWYSFQEGSSLRNRDGRNHVAWVKLTQQGVTLVGIEDKYNLGDGDYNDGMF
jgi:hypothetical protein